MLLIRRKRNWMLAPSKERIALTLLLIIIGMLIKTDVNNPFVCPHSYYGFPGEVYYQTCSGAWQINFLAIIANFALLYITACLLLAFSDKLKHGV
jgi:hypothetical protein